MARRWSFSAARRTATTVVVKLAGVHASAAVRGLILLCAGAHFTVSTVEVALVCALVKHARALMGRVALCLTTARTVWAVMVRAPAISAHAKHHRRASMSRGFTAFIALADLQSVHALLGAYGRLKHIVGSIASIAKAAQGGAAAVHAPALHHLYVNLLQDLLPRRTAMINGAGVDPVESGQSSLIHCRTKC